MSVPWWIAAERKMEMDKTRVGELLDWLGHAAGFGQGDKSTRERIRQYPVVAVLNPGEGEELLEVTAMSWDHEYGVLRLELAE